MYGGASAGRGSINDSMQEMSDQMSASPLNQSISRKKNKDENKAKPRDFNCDPKTLTILNAHKYDKMDDMTQLRIGTQILPKHEGEQLYYDVEKALNKLKTNWKTLDDHKFEYLVRKITINELMTIEERKHVRREAAEIKEKLRLKKEAEEDAKADQTF